MDNIERLPTVKEVLDRINNMDTSIRFGKIYQNAFRYSFLTAGRVGELVPPYAPRGRDVYKINVNDSEAVLFLVKTARHKGKIRPIALPLENDYEPWAIHLFKWFEVHENSLPFGGLTKRSFQRQAGILFDGLMWPVDAYRKPVVLDFDKITIIRERTKGEGGIEYLVEYPSGERHWVDDPRSTVDMVSTEPHWRPFTLESLRQLRIWELKYYFGFLDAQISIYTGLTGTTDDLRIPDGPLDEFIDSRDDLENQMRFHRTNVSTYFDKLLKTRE